MRSEHLLPLEALLSPAVRGLEPSPTLAINELSNRLRRKGRRILKLGLGQSPFPVPRPVVDALRENAHQKDYLPVRGLPELRRTVATHHRRVYGIDAGEDDILLGPGSKELIFLLQLTYPGDLVLPTPYWVSYVPQARLLGRPVHPLPTRLEDGFRLTAAALDAFCRPDPERPRLLLLNYPSNPTGATYAQGELAALAEVARRYRLLVLSDEIYGKLHHRGEHRSIAALYPEGTILSEGLSKWCGAGGWRLGVFAFPPALRWLLNAMAAVASETFTAVSAPIQHAAVRAYREDAAIERYLGRSRRVLRALGRRLADLLGEAAAAVAPPEGGFYLFPDFTDHRKALAARGITDSTTLCRRLLEDTGVATLPGSDFGRPPEELSLRLAYVNFGGERALGAVADDEDPGEAFLRRYCGETLEGVERLAGWIGGGGGYSSSSP